MKHNIKEMQSLYESGLTLQQVGYRYGITRERVRQLFAKVGIVRRPVGNPRSPLSRSFTCKECGKVKVLKNVPSPTRKFCEKKCMLANWNKKSLRHNLTKDEMRAYLSARARMKYNTRPLCKAGRKRSKEKYEKSEKYKIWYEKHKQEMKEMRAMYKASKLSTSPTNESV